MAGFQIPRVVPTVCKSIRFPQDVALAVEKVIEGRPCTFSAFVVAAVDHALEQLKQEEQGQGAG